MREILFRGKRLHNNGGWAKGFYCYNAILNEHRIQSTSGNYSEVDPATVGQYTGLKDKNGTKIFEGDYVHDTLVAVIDYHEQDGAFILTVDDLFHDWLAGFNGAVIGNIHDKEQP